MRPSTFTIAAALLLAGASLAQSTWIVDANGGPGTQFRDLGAAVDAAAPGDRILVRAGRYNALGIGKPLSILGDAGAVVSGGFVFGLRISGIPAGTTLAIRGLELTTVPVGTALVVSDCPGSVLLENVTCRTRARVASVRDLRMVQCTADAALEVLDATVALERCTITSIASGLLSASLHATGSEVVASRCRIRGRDGLTVFPGSAAIELDRSLVVVLDDGSGSVAAGNGTAPTSAIAGTGTLLLDPTAAVVPHLGAPPVAPTVATSVLRLPSLAVTGAPLGGSVQVDLFAVPAQTYALLLGGVAPPAFVPGVAGSLWLRDLLLVQLGVVGPTQRVGLSVPVPRVPALVGYTFAWQAVTADAAFTAIFSNPGSYVHRP